MRRVENAADLEPAQRAAARRGLKAMIPIGTRPFLDYVLSGLADAGIERVCVVVGPPPGGSAIREHYRGPARPVRLELEFATQPMPRGTADAVLAVEGFAAAEPVLCLNSDNLYPRAGLAALRALPRAGLIGFRRSALLRESNFPPERVAAYALIETNPGRELTRIVEKPSPAEAAEFGEDPLVSMNAWLLPPTIYGACRAIQPSPRGELELQDAIRLSITRWNERFVVLESAEAVLDLSHPEDIPAVADRLRSLAVWI